MADEVLPEPRTVSIQPVRKPGKRGPIDAARQTGEANGRTKLSDLQVEEIFSKYHGGGYLQKTLAEHYGVSIAQVSRICRGTRK